MTVVGDKYLLILSKKNHRSLIKFCGENWIQTPNLSLRIVVC